MKVNLVRKGPSLVFIIIRVISDHNSYNDIYGAIILILYLNVFCKRIL